jgi:hypothetical protein
MFHGRRGLLNEKCYILDRDMNGIAWSRSSEIVVSSLATRALMVVIETRSLIVVAHNTSPILQSHPLGELVVGFADPSIFMCPGLDFGMMVVSPLVA